MEKKDLTPEEDRAETEEEYRALRGGRDWDERVKWRHKVIGEAVEKMRNGGEFYPHPPISELLEERPDLRKYLREYQAQFTEASYSSYRVFPENLFSKPERPAIPSRLESVVINGNRMLDSQVAAAMNKLVKMSQATNSDDILNKLEDGDIDRILTRIFEVGARVELGKPNGRVLWNAMTVALGREPTHEENIRFLKAMRDAGWVNESFHVKKVRYLQDLANHHLPLAGSGIQDLTKENLELRNLIEDHKVIIEKLRAKLVEQDTVIGQIAGRNSKGN